MQTTNIETKENDLDVKYGMIAFREEPRESALQSLKYLYTDMTDIRKYYIRLGFHLDEFERLKYYNDFGYITMEEFCEKNLGLDKSAVSRCINVYRTFNAGKDVNYCAGSKTIGCPMELSEKWSKYSYTQLCEMLPLSDEQRKDIKPDMTIKQIREYKKKVKGKTDSAATQEEPVASTQPAKIFDYKKFVELKGAAEQTYIKSLSAKNTVGLYIFDSSGKRIGEYCSRWFDVLENGNDRIVIRMM